MCAKGAGVSGIGLPADSMAKEGVSIIEFTLGPKYIGNVIDGCVYTTTLVCPKCAAMMETTGIAYPHVICNECGLQLVPQDKSLELE